MQIAPPSQLANPTPPIILRPTTHPHKAPKPGTAPTTGEEESMPIDVATGIARILKQEGVAWVSTFPVCRANNALGR